MTIFLIVGAVVVLVLYLLYRLGSSTSTIDASTPWSGLYGPCYRVLRSGVPARGIVLQVGARAQAQGSKSSGLYEVRTVALDVEIPGRAPYECSCSLYIPQGLRPLVLPGATLELRVGSSQEIAVYGPGVGLAYADFAGAPGSRAG